VDAHAKLKQKHMQAMQIPIQANPRLQVYPLTHLAQQPVVSPMFLHLYPQSISPNQQPYCEQYIGPNYPQSLSHPDYLESNQQNQQMNYDSKTYGQNLDRNTQIAQSSGLYNHPQAVQHVSNMAHYSEPMQTPPSQFHSLSMTRTQSLSRNPHSAPKSVVLESEMKRSEQSICANASKVKLVNKFNEVHDPGLFQIKVPPGELGLFLKTSETGLEIERISDNTAAPALNVGDTIISIDGVDVS